MFSQYNTLLRLSNTSHESRQNNILLQETQALLSFVKADVCISQMVQIIQSHTPKNHNGVHDTDCFSLNLPDE